MAVLATALIKDVAREGRGKRSSRKHSQAKMFREKERAERQRERGEDECAVTEQWRRQRREDGENVDAAIPTRNESCDDCFLPSGSHISGLTPQ